MTDPKLMPKETVNVVGIGFRKSDDKFREENADYISTKISIHDFQGTTAQTPSDTFRKSQEGKDESAREGGCGDHVEGEHEEPSDPQE